MDHEKHNPVGRNLDDVDVVHADLRETFSGHEKSKERDVIHVHVDYVKRGPVLRKLGIHVDWDRHGPVVRNLGDDDVIRVVREKLNPVVENLGDVHSIFEF